MPLQKAEAFRFRSARASSGQSALYSGGFLGAEHSIRGNLSVRNSRAASAPRGHPSAPLLTGLPPRFFRHWRRSAPPSSPQKAVAAPPLLGCKRPRDAPPCFGPFAGADPRAFGIRLGAEPSAASSGQSALSSASACKAKAPPAPLALLYRKRPSLRLRCALASARTTLRLALGLLRWRKPSEQGSARMAPRGRRCTTIAN